MKRVVYEVEHVIHTQMKFNHDNMIWFKIVMNVTQNALKRKNKFDCSVR